MPISTSIVPAALTIALAILPAGYVVAEAPVVPTTAAESPAAPVNGKPLAPEATAVADVTLVSGEEKPAPPSDGVTFVSKTGEPGLEQVPSVAERISRIETSLETDTSRLQELKASLQSPDSEYAKAETDFRELDGQRTAIKQKLSNLENGNDREAFERLQNEATKLEEKWILAKERFNLAIGERKAMQESVTTLERKLEGDRASALKLKNSSEPQRLDTPAAVEPPVSAPAPQAEAAQSAPATPATVAPQPSAVPQAASPVPPAGAPLAAVPLGREPATPAAPVKPTPALTETAAKELAVASEVAQKRHAAAKAAEDDEQTITDRIAILQKDIGLQRQLRDSARNIADNSDKTLHSLNEDLFRKMMAGENIEDVRKKIEESTARLRENRAKSREISTRLDELQSQLVHLQSEKLSAANELAQKREDAQRAQAVVEKLKNPFTVRNLLQWLIDHGPRIVAILGFLAIFVWLSRVCEARLINLTAKRGRRGSREERENRAKTLLGIFRNVANIVIIAGGGMMILDEVGVPVAPIVGGAAVFGLAVAFGAQTLIRDYFVGFMVLFEQQYLVNDVIEIGDIKGQVERVSLRITVLRDLEGRVHFVPHSQINTVTNLTHGWSRAVFEIGVAYKENVDRVIQVLTTLAEELRRDEDYRYLIVNDPVMLGVDSFGDSAVIIKFYLQTRPLHQWTVKREMLRRIKNEFDRLGIEIPFPHVTVYRGTAQVENQAEDERSEQRPKRGAA